MIRSFRTTPYWSDDDRRDCVIYAACNVICLLFSENSLSYEVNPLHRSITLATAHRRPQIEGRLEVSNLLKLDNLGPVFQNAGGLIGIRKMTISRQGALQSTACLSNWLFEKEQYGRIIIARLFESPNVDKVLVIDSRWWPRLMYDSSDLYLITLSPSALFQCARPWTYKVRIVDLYEVFRHQSKYEAGDEVKRELLSGDQWSGRWSSLYRLE